MTRNTIVSHSLRRKEMIDRPLAENQSTSKITRCMCRTVRTGKSDSYYSNYRYAGSPSPTDKKTYGGLYGTAKSGLIDNRQFLT